MTCYARGLRQLVCKYMRSLHILLLFRQKRAVFSLVGCEVDLGGPLCMGVVGRWCLMGSVFASQLF